MQNNEREPMSVVTSVILSVSCAEDGFDPEKTIDRDKIDKINAFLVANGKMPLAFLTPHMGCGKHPQTMTFGGGYNHFPEDGFLDFIRALDFEYPENVVLVMQPEEGETFVWSPGAILFATPA